MADYQLLGDTFGYHPGYGAANAVQNASQSSAPGQPPPPPPGLGLMPPGSVGHVPGQSPYHSLQTPPGSQPRPGYPQTTDPLSMSNKLHQSYPGYGSAPTSISSQYSQSYMPPPPPHGAMDSYPGLSMSQASHLAASGGHHSLGSSYGPPPPHHSAMMAAQYSGQRLHSPGSLHTSARHPTMPSQYSPYASSLPNSSSSYHGGSTSELWSSSGQTSMSSHLQQSPFTNFQSPSQSTQAASNSAQTSSTLNSLHSSSSRTSQFSTSSDYGTSGSSNPYFPNHISNDPSSAYSTNYGAGALSSASQSQPPTLPTPSSSSSTRSSSSSRTQHQQYGSQLSSYNSSSQSTSSNQQSNQTTIANPVVASPATAVSNSAVSRFSHYSSYAPSISSYDPANQARSSPYSAPPATNNASQTPNSPQYRSNSGGYPTGSTSATSQLPVNSPRRTNATSPAGSPMPPTSHTPGPPSVGSTSTQSSNQGSSAFSSNASSSSHHLPNSATTGKPSSLQQLEQMVMPHLVSGTSNTSTTTTKSTNSSANNTPYYSTNTNSSPISPSQSQSQNKLFSHYSPSPSAPSSQFPYHHQYSQPNPTQPGAGSWPPTASGSPMSASNTHSLKSSGPGMMQPSLVHSAQHLSSSSSSSSSSSAPTSSSATSASTATNKSHSSSANDLITSSPYPPYNNSTPTNKSDLPAENNEYSQSSYNSSSSNSHPSASTSSATSSSSSSASTVAASSSSSASHSINQNNYMNSSLPRPPTSYDSMSSQQSKQSSLKNETIYDHNKSSRSVMDPMSTDQSQISNSYHSMMQPSAYGSQSMPPYPNHSRYDQPPSHSMQSNQYSITSDISNSSYNTADHDSSMLFDPYNIDNSLGMPPHQTMSEYRESQATIQQSSGVPSDYPPTDPYAANFDDYEMTSKRKGKGRPKKDNAAPKKERKPRQPRSQTTRGRGRGRGNKSMMDHIPLPGMMSHEYGGSPVGYNAPSIPPPPPPSSLGSNMNDSVDMYGSNNMDMYSTHLSSSASKVPSSNSMLPITPPTINTSVLPHHNHPPHNSELLSSPYGSKPTSIPTVPTMPPVVNQSNSHHMSSQQQSSNALNNRSPIPPQVSSNTISSPSLQPPTLHSSTASVNQTNYESVSMRDNSSSYNNYLNDESKMPTVVPHDHRSSGLNSASTPTPPLPPPPSSSSSSSSTTTVCDSNKDIVNINNNNNNNNDINKDNNNVISESSSNNNNNNNIEQQINTNTSKPLIASTSFDDSNFSIDSTSSSSEVNKDNVINNQTTSDQTNQMTTIPPQSSMPTVSLDSTNDHDDNVVVVEKHAPIPPSSSSSSLPPSESISVNNTNYNNNSQSQSIDNNYHSTSMISSTIPPVTTPMYPTNFENISKESETNQFSTTNDYDSNYHHHHQSNIMKDNNNDYNNDNTIQSIPPISNQTDMDISINNTFNDDTKMVAQGNFTSSTPIVEKPKKKRKSKKGETGVSTINNVDNETTLDGGKTKTKIKRKRTKKQKTDQQSIDENTMLSSMTTDQDDKTQLSASNLDMNNSIAPPDGETKTPAKRARPKKKKSKIDAENTDILNNNTTENESINDSQINNINESTTQSADITINNEEEVVKKPKVKNRAPKRKLPKLALKFKQGKKRRRGFGSPDNSDLEKTPPPSPDPDDEASIQKRRSARNTKRQRYNDDIDLDLSDEEFLKKSNDDQSQMMNVQLTEDTMVVEKILSSRMAKRELEWEPGEENANENNNKEPMFIEVEEFYVKYKNLSYLHCDWKTEEELEKGDRRVNQKIRRYRQKKDVNVFDFLDEEPFNPDYAEVDRILDVNEIEEIVEEEIEISDDETNNEDHHVDDKQENQSKQESNVNENNVVVEQKSSETENIVKDDKIQNDGTTIKEEKDSNVIDNDVNKSDDKSIIDDTDAKIKDNENDKTNDDNEVKQTSDNENKDSQECDNKDNNNKDVKEDDDKKAEPKKEEKCDEIKSINEEKKPIIETTKTKRKQIIKKTKIVRHFLVKWRGLSYEESTWELEDDIDDRSKIEQFWKFLKPPPRSEWKIKKKPKSSEWKKLEQSPVYKNGNTLREYQLEGVNWLSFCWHNGQNCILADEMGLGKTIQSITFIQEMVNYGIPYPYLVIVPLSTIGNWQREFETWTDLNVITYHGSSPSRNMLQDYEMYYKNEKNERIHNVYKFQVMITTFEVILTDCIELSSIKWVACIIDEAHRLKNRNCKLLEGLRMLSIDHRVLLTGTPLQNNVEELFSLLHFLEPSQFTSNENFMAEFGDLKTEAQVDKLKAILKPMMLRRLKEDVEKSLAPKEETIIEVELTNVQKKYYRAILERNFQFLSKGGTYANIPNLMNTVMELRKCCIHPFLINGAEEQIIQEFRSTHGNESTLNAIIQASGKLVLIDKLLPRLKDNGHRVLIFSQMVRCLDILEDYLCQKRYPFERIDGRVRGNLRQAAIDRFSKPDSDRFVFLLCTRAGGLGINLTAADTVIIFDSDWNPQNDLQAQARCHRIGQKKSVKVYRLICRNTYEREMFDRASLKLGLDKAVLQSMNSQKNLAENQLTKKEIEDLLKKGAYGALMEDDAAGDKFCEEDIDMILQRRTTKIVIESEGKGSTFSKASFATSDNRTDIEIDDPNFWEKWAKKANFDVDELKTRNELIVQEPRRRTQTKRFGADDAVLDISELDSSSEEDESISSRTRGSRNRMPGSKKKRKSRFYDPEHDEDYAQEIGFGWTRSEFFKVEKGLLTFGWGRWNECIILAKFKRNLSKVDIEDISRVILLFSLQNYKGDEKVKSFILDLITPSSEKNDITDLNAKQSAESRRSKKNKVVTKPICEELETLDWAKSEKYNPDVQMNDETYRKHLLRHANKILLRVRLLAYVKTDIIGDLHDKIFANVHVKNIPLPYCQPDCDPPAPWWNEEADKSLIIGVYKHGYDRYNMMRHDPSLSFLLICGPPDGAALLAELTSSEDDVVKMDDDEEPDTPATPATPAQDDKIKEGTDEKDKEKDKDEDCKEDQQSQQQQKPQQQQQQQSGQNYLPFPTSSEMNNRLRRLVTSYQRNFKKEEARIAQKARHMQRLERLEKFEAAIRERENKKQEQAQKKWSRREESDFYRVVSSFGIEYNKKTDTFDWTRFRMYAKLEKKLDETLTEYFKAFHAMCKKVVGRRLSEDEENLPITVDPITEERANRCLARIELLNKIRDEILHHPELDERLKICQTQLDLPEWWIYGKHDKDLLIGAAKYGLNRLDYNLMNDIELSFIEIVRNFEAQTAAEEKAANEFENEIRSIINNMIDEISKEFDDPELTSEDGQTTKPPESEITPTTYIRPQLKWPRDRVLQIRLENVCLAVEKNEWPTFRNIATVLPHSNNAPSIATTADSSPRPSTPCSLSSASQETPHPTPDHTPRHETQSPFTPSAEYFYTPNNVSQPGQIISSFDDSNKKRRRRRKENEKTKLHSLLNVVEQSPSTSSSSSLSSSTSTLTSALTSSSSISNNNNKIKPNITTQSASHVLPGQNNPNTFANLSLFKNNKTVANSLLNTIPSQFLTPFLNNLPANIRSTLRDELMNDEKAASILFGPSFQSTLAAAVANVTKSQTAKSNSNVVAQNSDTTTSKGGIHASGPPPAHQSSSRNALSLGSLDLTSKFKSATSAVLEKTNVSSNRSSNIPAPFPAHKQSTKNSSEKVDVLDLSSVPCKTSGGTTSNNNKSNTFANLLSQTLKKPFSETSSANSAALPVGGSKKKGKTGSRIDALALNLQAKKMMEEVKHVENSSVSNTSLPLSNKFPLQSQQQQQQQQSMSSTTTPSAMPNTSSTSNNLSRNLFNEKDLLAAFTSLSSQQQQQQQQHDKRQSSNTLFEELSKSPLFHSVKKNALANLTQQASSLTTSNTTIGTKKPLAASDVSKAYFNMMESLKLLSKQSSSKTIPPTTSSSDKNSLIDPKTNLMKQNFKALLEENPELLSQSSTFLSIFNNPLFAQSLSQGIANQQSTSNSSASTTATVNVTPSQSSISLQQPPVPNVDDKTKNTRSSKRTRSQFEATQSSSNNNNNNSNLGDESMAKRSLLNVPGMSSLIDPKKYLSSLLEKTNSDLKNVMKDKTATQTPFKTPSVSHSSSSIRTRTSDKRSSQTSNSSSSSSSSLSSSSPSSSSSSSTSSNRNNNNNPNNFGNLNASSLLNNLSLAAAAAATSGSSNKQQTQQQQQQAASSLLANTYVNALNATGKSNPNFANFANLGFNNNMLSGLPSMKMFLDAATAAAAAVSKATSSTNSTNTNSTVTSTTPTSTATTTTPSLSSFANLFGINNPLFNFSNFSNLANFNQSGNKKDGSPGNIDFASLASSLASSATANLNVGTNEDKTKSSSNKNSSTSGNNNSKSGKNPLNSAASMLASSGLPSSASLPFLYSNPNFPMPSLYPFGLTSPFLNNPNFMNGLANFSNVFTSTTSTPTSTSSVNQKSKLSTTSSSSSSSSSSTNKGNSKSSSMKSSTTGPSSSGIHSNAAAASSSSTTMESDNESLKSSMANEEEEDLNGEFDGHTSTEKDTPKARNNNKRNRSAKHASTTSSSLSSTNTTPTTSSKDYKSNRKSSATSK